MLQISTDVTSLTLVQREALAGFILSFPATEVVSVDEDDEDANTEEDIKRAFGYAVEDTEIPAPPPPATVMATHIALVDESRPGVEPPTRDKNGLPWDERIHASSRALVADGSWRAKRGVDAGLVAQVEAELKALMAIPSPFGQLSDNGPLPVVIPAPPVEAPAYVIPPPPSPSVVIPQAKHCNVHDAWFLDSCQKCTHEINAANFAVPVPPPAMIDFMGLLTYASTNVQVKKLTTEEVNGIVQAAGIPSLPLLQNRPDLVPQIYASISALIASR